MQADEKIVKKLPLAMILCFKICFFPFHFLLQHTFHLTLRVFEYLTYYYFLDEHYFLESLGNLAMMDISGLVYLS